MLKLIVFALLVVAGIEALGKEGSHHGFKRKIIPTQPQSQSQQPIRTPRQGQLSDSNSLAENLLALPEASEAVAMLRREQPELFQEVMNGLHNAEGLTVLVPSNDAMSQRQAGDTEEDEIRATIQYSILNEPLSSSDIIKHFEELKQQPVREQNQTESTTTSGAMASSSASSDEQVESIFLTTLLNDPEHVRLLGHAQFLRVDRAVEGLRSNKSASPSESEESESESGTSADTSSTKKKINSKTQAVKADESEESSADFQFVYGIEDGEFEKASVVKADVKCKNGYIHVIDKRPSIPDSVSDVIDDLKLTQVKTLLEEHHGLETVLDRVPAVTIFLPSDEAVRSFQQESNQTSSKNETSEPSEEEEESDKESETESESGLAYAADGKTLPIRTGKLRQSGQKQQRLAILKKLQKRQQLPIFAPGSVESSLLNGIVQGVHFSSDFSDGITFHTLSGGTLKLKKDEETGDFTLNDATIEMKDIIVENGVVHVISKIFTNEDVKAAEGPMPVKEKRKAEAVTKGQVSEEQTLLENLQAIPDFSKIAEMLEEKDYSDLRQLLSGESESETKTANQTESEESSSSEQGLSSEQKSALRSRARSKLAVARRKKAAVVSAVRANRADRAENQTAESEEQPSTAEKIEDEGDTLGFDLSNVSKPLTLFFPTNDALYRMYLKIKNEGNKEYGSKHNYTGNFQQDWSIENYRQLPREMRRKIKAGVLYHILQGEALTMDDFGPINIFDTLLNDAEFSKMRNNGSLPLVILNTAASLNIEGSKVKKAKLALSKKLNESKEESSASEAESEKESSSGLGDDEAELGYPVYRRTTRRLDRRYSRRFDRRFGGVDAESEKAPSSGLADDEAELGYPVYRRTTRRLDRRYSRRFDRRFGGVDADMDMEGTDFDTEGDLNPDEEAVAVVVPVQSPVYAPAYYPAPYPVPVGVPRAGYYPHAHAHYRPARAQHRRYARRYGRRFGRRGMELEDLMAGSNVNETQKVEDQDQMQEKEQQGGIKQEPTPVFIQFGLQSHPAKKKAKSQVHLKSNSSASSAENTTESESSNTATESESESEKPVAKSKLRSKPIKSKLKSKSKGVEVGPLYSMIVIPDIISSNGVLHGIDTVLEVPRDLNHTVHNTEMTDFLTALDDEGELENIMNAESVTILYPTNDALRDALSKNTSGSENRTSALLDFIIDEDVFFTTDLMNETSLTAMSGKEVKISFDDETGSLMINNMSLVVGDVVLDNGVMHILGEKPKKLEAESCDNKKCPQGDECCEVLVSGLLTAQCYSPDTHVCAALKGSKLCPRTAPNVCGSACFSESQFVCLEGDLLCPLNMEACGKSCFDPEIYECDPKTSELTPIETASASESESEKETKQEQEPEPVTEEEEKPKEKKKKAQAVRRRSNK